MFANSSNRYGEAKNTPPPRVSYFPPKNKLLWPHVLPQIACLSPRYLVACYLFAMAALVTLLLQARGRAQSRAAAEREEREEGEQALVVAQRSCSRQEHAVPCPRPQASGRPGADIPQLDPGRAGRNGAAEPPLQHHH